MDVLKSLAERIESIPDAKASIGLKAVLNHLEVGLDHVARGRREKNPNAYTDAVYRANQAFEGTVKESYKFLAGKDPKGKQVAQLEKYLLDNALFTDRVINLFANYRQDWRNPATHEYWQDFRQGEGVLACLSCAGFLFALLDQLEIESAAKLGEELVVSSLEEANIMYPGSTQPLTQQISKSLILFGNLQADTAPTGEPGLVGQIAGYLRKSISSITVRIDENVSNNSLSKLYADLIAERMQEKVAIEVKELRKNFRAVQVDVLQVGDLVRSGALNGGILYLHAEGNEEYFSHTIPVKTWHMENSTSVKEVSDINVVGPLTIIEKLRAARG